MLRGGTSPWQNFLARLISRSPAAGRAAMRRRRRPPAPAAVVQVLESRVLLSAGDLDPGFGNGGVVTTDVTDFDFGNDVAVQSDGKIVLVGDTNIAASAAYVLRYNPDGTLDSTFGTGGKATVTIDSSDFSPTAVAVQSDGRIVVAGDSGDNFAVARLNADGTLDSTFGTGGTVVTDFGGSDRAEDVAVQSDGRIIVVGTHGNPLSGVQSENDFAVARYNSDGSLDITFGTGGKVTTDFAGDDDSADAVVVQSDGRIVVGGLYLPRRQ